RELVLGLRHLGRRHDELRRDRRQLIVEHLYQMRSGLGPTIEVRHLLVEIVYAALQLGCTALQILALAPNALERVALRAEARVLRPQDEWRREQQADDEGDGAQRASRADVAHTRRRCRPTDTALPSSPMSAPNRMPSNARRRSKNAVSKWRYWAKT